MDSRRASLVQASDGNFYGMAFEGGTFTNLGAIFRISPGGSETLLLLLWQPAR